MDFILWRKKFLKKHSFPHPKESNAFHTFNTTHFISIFKKFELKISRVFIFVCLQFIEVIFDDLKKKCN